MILRAVTAFFADGRTVHPGDIVSAADPIVPGRESLFEEVTEPTVETATARPGEKRTVVRTKKAGPKKAAGKAVEG